MVKKIIKFKEKKIILCCGCLENIKLLSRSYEDRKIKNINFKILGRFFMNHPKNKFRTN